MNGKLLTPKWIFTTLLVIAAVGVMVRLGFWQLDRLEQRRVFNQHVETQQNSAPLDLNQVLATGELRPEDLNEMEYRQVTVRGEYRPSEEVAWRNQVWENQPGYHLLTPLVLDGTSTVVMVDRGWIPLDQGDPAQWGQYAQPGKVQVQGLVRLAQNRRVLGAQDPALLPGQSRMDAWNAVNLERIAQQVQGDLLPVFVVAAPNAGQTALPYRMLEQPDLSEGSHMGYAFQWFSFAAVLAFGYPFFVRKQLNENNQPVS